MRSTGRLLALVVPEGLAALAAALAGPLLGSGAGQLQHNHALVVLAENAHHLPECVISHLAQQLSILRTSPPVDS